MKHDRHDQFAERWLDEALAHYSDAEPRNGLESRILANLAAQNIEHVPTWRRFVWVPVICAAIVALVVGMSVLRETKRPATKTVVVVSPRAPVLAQEPPTNSQRPALVQRPPVRKLRAVVAKASEPRQSQFPAPEPPTEQERLLAAYLSVTPTHELLAVAADQQAWRDRVKKNAESRAQEPAQIREINHLQVSPLEGGSTEADAFGTR